MRISLSEGLRVRLDKLATLTKTPMGFQIALLPGWNDIHFIDVHLKTPRSSFGKEQVTKKDMYLTIGQNNLRHGILSPSR